MILPSLFIDLTEQMGRGVFTREPITSHTVIEVAPVIVMSAADRILLDQTLLYHYIFEWGEQENQCCMALGYIPVYNHSYRSNCEYEMDYDEETITVRATQFIEAGQELFINYNGPWNDDRTVWFHHHEKKQ